MVVVDDGSTDQTAAEIERIARNESRVRLFRQENRGKARALQRGLAAAHNGIVVFLDADTQCQRDTLRRLLEPFADERIGAVSGHAKVGNLRTFIARCQALEYTCGFNLDRRAYNRWKCITVVPGAISAIRKDAIDEAGGLSLETLAEDTDLTLSLHRHRQRMFMCLTRSPGRKRRDGRHARAATFAVGLRHAAMSLETSRHGVQLELSRARLVQFAQRLVFPDHSRRHHADGGFVPAGVAAIWRLERGAAVRHRIPGMDVLLATLACILEREPILRAWRILPMRLIYRPMLSYCVGKQSCGPSKAPGSAGANSSAPPACRSAHEVCIRGSIAVLPRWLYRLRRFLRIISRRAWS